MTKEEKILLLQDLSGRLPYKVKGLHREQVHTVTNIEPNSINPIIKVDGYDAWFPIEMFKPYLRPMSSMTEKELNELLEFEDIDYNNNSNVVKRAMMAFSEDKRIESNSLFCIQYARSIDWLNTHHFDYRGLIEKGLALEAPEGMYN